MVIGTEKTIPAGMREIAHDLVTAKRTILLPPTKSERKVPINLRDGDRHLFEKEFERDIFATELLKLENVRVNAEGLIFRQMSVLPQSFVNAALPPKQQRLKSRLKFLGRNYLRRKTIEVSNHCVWFVNNWSYNYFHWMTDSIPRLFAASALLPDVPVLLPSRYERTQYVQSSLRAFGRMDLQFVPEHQVFLLRTLLLPTETAVTGNYNDDLMKRLRRLYVNYYCDHAPSVRRWGDKIYVSRGKARRRRIVNEDGVIALLKDYGFETVYFEDLSFDEQAIISLHTKYLISNHGAGLTNMLFMREGSSVLELRLAGDTHSNCYFSLASALGLNYLYQTCRSRDDTEDAHTADLIVDFRMLRANIELMLRHDCGRSNGFDRSSVTS